MVPNPGNVLSLRSFILLAALLASIRAWAQEENAPRRGSTIVDDSTRNVYGPHTSMWTTEQDLFDNRPNYRKVDTTIHNYHRWTYVQQSDYTFQDLGVMGTALNPIFPTMSKTIGANAGFHTYEPYYASQEPRYWDTKSPMTRMRIIWGGSGRAMTDIEFSRNINPRWNFGFTYRPILIEKQIQSKGKADKQTTSQYYDFFTTYRTKNNRYALLFNFRRIRHKVIETGGVKVGTGDQFTPLFDPNASPNLTAAKTEEFRRNFHLSHRFQLDTALQIYHIADFSDQTNSFTDNPSVEPAGYYDHVEVDSAQTNDMTEFKSMQQEAGIKGNASKFFYSAYYRFRSYDYYNLYLTQMTPAVSRSGTENYLGGRISLKLDSVKEFVGSAEFLFGGYYKVEGKISSPWLDATFKTSLSKPGSMQMNYRGSHDFWNQYLSGIGMTEARGFLKMKAGGVFLQAGGTFTLLNNYVYFRKIDTVGVGKQSVLPYQSKGVQSTFSPEINASINFFRNFYFRPRVIYTSFLRNDDGQAPPIAGRI